MSKQVITLSDRAAERVKEIIASAKEPIIGVRVGVDLSWTEGFSWELGPWRAWDEPSFQGVSVHMCIGISF